MTTTTKQRDPYATIWHRDGTITHWDVYQQGWRRQRDETVTDRTTATWNESERARLNRRLARARN